VTGRLPARTLAVLGLVMVAVILPFMVSGEALDAWARAAFAPGRPLGLAAQASCVGLLAGDVLLPVPSSLVSATATVAWGPWRGGALVAVGMTLGSIFGCALGRWAGRERVRRWLGPSEDERLRRLYERHGEWIVLTLRPVPVLAEASAVFAGVGRMPWGRYLALSTVANVVVALFYAAAGAWLRGAAPDAGLTLLLAVLAATALAWVLIRRLRDRATEAGPP
jgi:uncharacterized membrane protein YdjX (TVP38/TMEM64 family)